MHVTEISYKVKILSSILAKYKNDTLCENINNLSPLPLIKTKLKDAVQLQ